MDSLNPIHEASGEVAGIQWGWAARACAGERVSGDTVAVREHDGRLHVAIVDVLGHGRAAHAVAQRVDGFLAGRDLSDPTHAMQALHDRLRGGLGAAVGLGVFDPGTATLSWASVGNTVARRVGEQPGRVVPQDGIVGQILPRLKPSSLSLVGSSVLALYTDGLSSGFDTSGYPQLRYQSASTVARTLLKRFGRGSDDCTILVLRRAP